VIPGISSIQALAASHAIPLNEVAGTVHITTGRRLAEDGFPADAESVLVMLDGSASFARLALDQFHIWWGAYLGSGDEIVVSGPLAEVAERIAQVRADARKRHGWIMDIYLLRRMPGAD
jgi:precorrin-6A synthase